MIRKSKPKRKNIELLNKFLNKIGKRDLQSNPLGKANKKLQIK